jgi:hypothetical protein
LKIRKSFKYFLYLSLLTLYATGVFVWILNTWFKLDRGLGPEPSPYALTSLHIHSVIGLWFLILFGYLFHSHILPSLRRKQKLKSGWAILSVCIILILTVPGLFYFTDGSLKSTASLIHIDIGLASLFVFAFHLRDRLFR